MAGDLTGGVGRPAHSLRDARTFGLWRLGARDQGCDWPTSRPPAALVGRPGPDWVPFVPGSGLFAPVTFDRIEELIDSEVSSREFDLAYRQWDLKADAAAQAIVAGDGPMPTDEEARELSEAAERIEGYRRLFARRPRIVVVAGWDEDLAGRIAAFAERRAVEAGLGAKRAWAAEILEGVKRDYDGDHFVSIDEALAPLRLVDVLVLEGACAFRPTAWALDTLSELLEHRLKSGLLTLLTVHTDDASEIGEWLLSLGEKESASRYVCVLFSKSIVLSTVVDDIVWTGRHGL